MKIHPVYKKEYRGILVPGFNTAIELCKEIARCPHTPSTTRVSNQQETGLSFSMRSPATGMKKFIQKTFMDYIVKVKRFPMKDACLMILGTEGETESAVRKQSSALLSICRKYGAVDLGTAVGKRWYAGKYDYPYLRDLMMNSHILVDVVETAAPWDVLPLLYKTLDDRVHELLKDGEFPGYFGCHLSHSYPDGACLYFTFGTTATPGDEMKRYFTIKKLIYNTLLEFGAALSHHHAVGYELLPWIPEYNGPTTNLVLRQLKKALDPKNICNPGKLIPAESGTIDEQWIGELFAELPS
jgi:alkyldihydroxyacetonephosphate synthase